MEINDQFFQVLIVVGMMAVGFVSNAVYLKGVFGERLNSHDDAIKQLRKEIAGAQTEKTCNANFNAHDYRITRLERAQNGN